MRFFTIAELSASDTAKKHGITNVPPAQAVVWLTALTRRVLDPLRLAWGKPLHVNSGYRCPQLNTLVGGVPGSQHTLGQAADITAGSPEANERLWQLLRSLRLPVDQAICEHHYSWLHISYGPRNRRSYFSL